MGGVTSALQNFTLFPDLGIRFSHSLGETQRRHYFTPIFYERGSPTVIHAEALSKLSE